MTGASSAANDVVRLKLKPAFVPLCVKVGAEVFCIALCCVAGCQCTCKEAHSLLLEGIPHSRAGGVCSDGFIW
jgi:hypothetical protein